MTDPTVKSFGDIVVNYDAFLIDQFGVLLHGDGAYAFAPQALKKLSSLGKKILLLSNSGKRAKPNEDRLVRLGFDRESFIGVLSSGEAAYHLLRDQIGNEIEDGAEVFIISRDGDSSSVDGLGFTLAQSASEADLILIGASESEIYPLSYYKDELAQSAQSGTPCLCTNPDMTMMTRLGLRFGAGKIAQCYEEMGGTVEWIGKPHQLIYEIAKNKLSEHGALKVLCIGDSPNHDILGGHRAGLDTALVRTGIHAEEPLSVVLEKCATNDAMPDHIIKDVSFDGEIELCR